MNSDEARAVIAEDQKTRMQAFTDELGALCEKHKCSLSAVPIISQNGSIVAEIRVVPR